MKTTHFLRGVGAVALRPAAGRWILGAMLGLGLLTGAWTVRADESAPTRWEQQARESQAKLREVVWPTHEPLEFVLRRGDHYDDEPERYEVMCSETNIARMASAGLKFARIFFYKGFGLEYERANMEKAKQTAEILHRYGMKVDYYIGGTMFTETLYQELPKARNWEQRDQDNLWVPYGTQTFRHYACPNEPAYRDYLKRIVRLAVVDAHADELTFDNIMLQPEPKSCRCPRCQKAFQEYLRQKYPTPEAVRRRFGLPSVEWIRINEWQSADQAENTAVLNDPVLQEWVRFRCESLAHYACDLYDYAKSLNPNVSVLFNFKGLYSFNRYWANAVYHPLYSNHVDVISFDTTGYEARLDPATGALVSQIRSYKVGRGLNSSCEESLREELRAAVHMAFNFEKPVPGYAGAPWIDNPVSPIIQFYKEYHDRYYTGTKPVADVAVLRTWASMAYSISATYVPATLMEQVLIQHKIPFDLLFDENFNHLERYQAIILAGQECVSNAQVEQLLAYVRAGGTLVVAGNTAQYNQWRERRRANPLLPARSEGKGRILYIPEMVRADAKGAKAQGSDVDPEPGATQQKNTRLSPAQWVLPRNHEQIAHTIEGGLPQGLSIRTEAPLTTVMELANRPATTETLMHFINFDKQHPLQPFEVSLHKQYAGKVKSVTCFSHEHEQPIPVAFEEKEGRVTFTVPAMRLYSMVVIGCEP